MPGSPPLLSSKPRSFVTLDFLRGVAAIPVLHLHTAQLYGVRQLFPHAFLAVDFFFMLSGFVMAYVYGERLDAGWSTPQFLRTRLIRLYPLYFFGWALGAAFAVLWARFGRLETTHHDLAFLLVLGFFFLPAPPPPFLPTARGAMYPLDVPAWSLFYEGAANVVHAVFLRRRSTRFLAILVAVFALATLALALRTGGIDFGVNRTEFLPGFCRMLFGYPTGMLLYRVWRTGRFHLRIPSWAVALLLLATMMVPTSAALQPVYEWAVVVLVFPLLLLLGAHVQPRGRFVRVSQIVGARSYPVYILHVPCLQFFEQIWMKATHHRIAADAPWSGLVFLALLLPTAWLLGELYDPEARKLLHARLFPALARNVPGRAA